MAEQKVNVHAFHSDGISTSLLDVIMYTFNSIMNDPQTVS